MPDKEKKIGFLIKSISAAFVAGCFAVVLCPSPAKGEPAAEENIKADVRPQIPANKKFSLVDCLNEVLRNNSEILLAQKELERAKRAVVSAKAVLYPHVTGSVTSGLSDGDLFNDKGYSWFKDSWSVSLNLNHSLYSGGRNRNQVAISKLSDDLAAVQFQTTVNQLIHKTRVAFYDVIVNQSEIEVRKQNIELLKREVERQKGLFKAGRTTRFNIVRTEVRLANEMPGFEISQNNMRTSVMNLMELMGKNWTKDFKIEDFQLEGELSVTPYPSDPDEIVYQALSRSPELTAQDKQAEINKRQLQIAKATYIPTLNLNASTGVTQDDAKGPGFFDHSTSSTVALTGSWNIFDGFSGVASAKLAKIQVERGAIQREQVARRIEYDVRKALLTLQQAETSLKSQKGNVAMATQAVDLAKSAVENGMGTQLDILQATVDLKTAQNIELKARHQYSVALADLDRVMFSRMFPMDAEVDSSIPSIKYLPSKPPIRAVPSNLSLRSSFPSTTKMQP